MPPLYAENSSGMWLPDPTWRLSMARAAPKATALSYRTISSLLHSDAQTAAAEPAVTALESGRAHCAAMDATLTPQAADMVARLRVGFRLEAQRSFVNVRGAQRLSEFATDTFLALRPMQVEMYCIL